MVDGWIMAEFFHQKVQLKIHSWQVSYGNFRRFLVL